MGIFDIFGSSSKSKGSGSSSGTGIRVGSTNKASATSSQTGSVAATQETGVKSSVNTETGSKTFELMDEATRKNLADAVATLSSDLSGNNSDIDFLRQRARGGDAALDAAITDIMEAERLKGTQALNAQLNVLAQGLGSRTGSGFQRVAGQQIGDLGTKLAGTAGQLKIGARQTVTDELTKVADLLNSSKQTTLSGITGIASVLKGAAGSESFSGTSTGNEIFSSQTQGEQISTTNTINQDILAALDMTMTDEEFENVQKGTQGASITDFLGVIGSFAGG